MVIFGLGNPGRKYARTRHNLGFMVVDELARNRGARWRSAANWQSAGIEIAGNACVLVKPMTFMNNSGFAVREYLARHKDDFVVVFDDLDLPLGRLRIRPRGSAGGHQGIASIVDQLTTDDFARVRIGIGPKPRGRDAADFVLDRFGAEEEEHLPNILKAGQEAVQMIVAEGTIAAMNRFNRMKLIPNVADDTAMRQG